MKIDNHVHIGTSEKLSGRYLTFKSCYELMKRSGIDRVGAIPNLSSVVKTSELNNNMMQAYTKSGLKDSFYPIIVMDPKDTATLDQIVEYESVIAGVKYHPSISEMPLTEKEMIPFLETVNEYGLSVLIHCGRHWRSNVSYIIEAATKFTDLTFIAAHMAGNATDLVVKAIDLIKKEKADNIYLDTSASKLPWLIEEAVRLLGPDRILFGSDEPYADVRIATHCVDLCDISDEDKELIFYKNFERIYTNGK